MKDFKFVIFYGKEGYTKQYTVKLIRNRIIRLASFMTKRLGGGGRFGAYSCDNCVIIISMAIGNQFPKISENLGSFEHCLQNVCVPVSSTPGVKASFLCH